VTGEIRKLTDYQHVRKLQMYLGGRDPHTQDVIIYDAELHPEIKSVTWIPAVFVAFREGLDNAADEAAHGFGDRIDITYDDVNSIFSIRDYGRGVPIDWDEDHKCHKVTLALGELKAGRNFDERNFVAGTNGIGISAVNMSSEWFEVDVWRDKKHFHQRFEEDLVFDEHKKHDPVIGRGSKNETGTLVKFKLSREVFKDTTLPMEFVRSRVFELALGRPELTITFNGEVLRVKKLLNIFQRKEAPLAEMEEGTPPPPLPTKPMVLETNDGDFTSQWILVPYVVTEGDFCHSVVNGIPVFDGGPHIDAFRRSFCNKVISELEREIKKRKVTPNKADVMEGLLVFNLTRMRTPNFNSQAKTKLTNEEAGKIVWKEIDSSEVIATLIKKNPEWIESIFARALARQSGKEMDEAAWLAKKVKKQKVDKFTDCSTRHRAEAILFITEGDSALGAIKAERDPRIHALYPIQGKPRNVHSEKPTTILKDTALAGLMNVIGLPFGKKDFKRSELRFGKVYITADADEDGKDIVSLLTNFFHTYWPQLFDPKYPPFFYVFLTPYVVLKKKTETKFFYSFNYDEFDPADWKGWAITRAKGLAALKDPEWEIILKDPVAYPLIADEDMGKTLDLLFNPALADQRKDWMGI